MVCLLWCVVMMLCDEWYKCVVVFVVDCVVYIG